MCYFCNMKLQITKKTVESVVYISTTTFSGQENIFSLKSVPLLHDMDVAE